MATKKSVTATTKKAAPKKAAAATKTTVTRVSAKPAVAPKTKAQSVSRQKINTKLPTNLVNIVLAETFGTFVLTMTALFAAGTLAPLYVGLALVALVLGIGAVSGAHVNPAVTFGLWSMRKLQTVLVPFYWVSQFLGAMAAVVLMSALSGGAFAIHFSHFMTFSWAIFALELVGAAIFMFGIAGVLSRADVKAHGKALGVGLSLTIALVASAALVPMAHRAAIKQYRDDITKTAQQDTQEQSDVNDAMYPHELHVSGATLNPAVALGVTEWTNTQAQSNGQYPPQETERLYSRLSLEVILATLVGAALGGNLFLLVNYRNKAEA